jgi:hypothetical protein
MALRGACKGYSRARPSGLIGLIVFWKFSDGSGMPQTAVVLHFAFCIHFGALHAA